MKNALVIIPGFRGSSTEVQFVEIANRLRPAGIETLTVDWPGWKADLSKYSMSATLDIVRQKISELQNGGYEIVLTGESLGGVVATIAASEFKLAGLILLVTPSRFLSGDDMEARLSIWKEQGYVEFVSKSSGTVSRIPYSFAEDALKHDATNYIGKVTAPVSYIVSTADKSVPNESTRKLYESTTTPKEWIVFDGMDHTYRTQPEFLEKVVAKVVELTSKYLRGTMSSL